MVSGGAAGRAAPSWTEQARTLLVVLDQFEDYFLYHPNERGEETFDGQFPQIVNEANLRVNSRLLREDAWAKLDRFEGRVPQLFANYVRIEHLDRAGARNAVEGLIVEYNRLLPAGEAEYIIEPGARRRGRRGGIDERSRPRPGRERGAAGQRRGRDAVPAARDGATLARDRRGRWSRAHAGDFVQLGGAQRIVETHLVDASARSILANEIAADAFRYLVTSPGAGSCGRPRPLGVAGHSGGGACSGAGEARLGESGRIPRPVPPPPGGEQEGRRYEIFHDVLGEPILEWRREFERTRAGRRGAAPACATAPLALIAAALVLVLAFAGFAAWALHERVASDRAEAAESQALAARSLRAQSLDPKQSLVLASQAEDKSSTPQAGESLRRALVGWPKPTVLVPRGRTVYGVDFSPTAASSTAGKGGARVVPIGGGTAKTLVPRKLVTSVRFSPDGRFVVAATADGRCASGALPAGASWRVAPASARIFSAPRSATTDGFSSQGVIRVGETGSGASLTDGLAGS